MFLRRYSEAEQAYHSGLKRDPDNQQLKEGLADAQKYSEDYIKSGYIVYRCGLVSVLICNDVSLSSHPPHIHTCPNQHRRCRSYFLTQCRTSPLPLIASHIPSPLFSIHSLSPHLPSPPPSTPNPYMYKHGAPFLFLYISIHTVL